jgi:hypothetical protein
MLLLRTLTLAILAAVIATPASAQYRSRASIVSFEKVPTPSLGIPDAMPLLRHLAVDCELDRTRGREAASNTHNSANWMIGGVLSGVVLGLIGTLAAYAIASSSTVEVLSIPEGVEPTCYRDGFVTRAKGKNCNDALVGGLLGTAILVLIVVAATSGTTY